MGPLGVRGQSFSHVCFFVTPWTIGCQSLLSMEVFRQEYWSRLPFPFAEDLGLQGDPTSQSKGIQLWIFIGRTDAEAEAPILWPPDVKNWLIGKGPDAGKDWRQEKGKTEDEMVGWHHWLNRHDFEQSLGDGDGQESKSTSCLLLFLSLNSFCKETPGTWASLGPKSRSMISVGRLWVLTGFESWHMGSSPSEKGMVSHVCRKDKPCPNKSQTYHRWLPNEVCQVTHRHEILNREEKKQLPTRGPFMTPTQGIWICGAYLCLICPVGGRGDAPWGFLPSRAMCMYTYSYWKFPIISYYEVQVAGPS